MASHDSPPDTSNDEAIAKAQQKAEYMASVPESISSRYKFPKAAEPETPGKFGGIAIWGYVEHARRRRKRTGKASKKSAALGFSGQQAQVPPQNDRSFQSSGFRVLDTPPRWTRAHVSQHLSPRIRKPAILSTATIDPNGLGSLPKMIKIRPPTPPEPVCWRGSSKRQITLDLDMSRIDSDYLLSNEFIHDINQMLNKITGWSVERVEPYELSFQQDPDNSGRQVKLIECGVRDWILKISNPNQLRWRPSMGHNYTFQDLPEACQVHGCSPDCPRKTLGSERRILVEKRERSRVSYQRQITPIREGSRMSTDLPRIFGKQTHPIPPLNWKLLEYRGLKDLDVAEPLNTLHTDNARPVSPEKRRQHFVSCSPPKKTRHDGVLESIDYEPEVTYIERLPEDPKPSTAIPLQPPATPLLAPASLPKRSAGLNEPWRFWPPLDSTRGSSQDDDQK